MISLSPPPAAGFNSRLREEATIPSPPGRAGQEVSTHASVRRRLPTHSCLIHARVSTHASVRRRPSRTAGT